VYLLVIKSFDFVCKTLLIKYVFRGSSFICFSSVELKKSIITKTDGEIPAAVYERGFGLGFLIQ